MKIEISDLPVSPVLPLDGNIPSILPTPPPEIAEEKGKPFSANGWHVLKHHKNKQSKKTR